MRTHVVVRKEYNDLQKEAWLKHIPNTTLLMIDGGVCLELARLSLLDTLNQCTFDEVLVVAPDDIRTDRTQRYVPCPGWHSAHDPGKWIWHELPGIMRCENVLITTWDAWVIDGDRWENEFLNYDYVGAPWWYNDDRNVGHGLLRSRCLLDFLHENAADYVVPIHWPEDAALSRIHRPRLEEHGFRWADEQTASRFMFECTRPSEDSKHFIFHDSFNFKNVLDPDRLEERTRLMLENPYLGPLKLEHNRTQSPQILPRLTSGHNSMGDIKEDLV
jgi:Protein of unknown function (DUF5672)